MKKRIAIIVDPELPTPPNAGYGGIQRNLYDFTEEIDGTGYFEIYLFATKDSDISCLSNTILLSSLDQGTRAELVVNNDFELRSEEEIYYNYLNSKTNEKEFVEYVISKLDTLEPDIILVAYDNSELIEGLKAKHYKTIWSIRSNIDSNILNLINKYQELTPVVFTEESIPKEAHITNRNLRIIPWGIKIDKYNFSDQPLKRQVEPPSIKLLNKLSQSNQDYFVMVASIGAHKSQLTAIKIARYNHIKLIIAGTPQDHVTTKKTDYFKKLIMPMLSDDVIYFGNANEEEKTELLRFAKASIAPYGYELEEWREPFGRAVIESMACGTPVIGYNHGSLRNIIKDGKSGLLFNDIEETRNLISKIKFINRWETRRWAKINYDIKIVARNYMRLIEEFAYEKK